MSPNPQIEAQAPTNITQAHWMDAVDGELKNLLTEARSIRTNMDGSKTATKKRYFYKKFVKVQRRVVQLLQAKEHMMAVPGETDVATIQ